MFASHT